MGPCRPPADIIDALAACTVWRPSPAIEGKATATGSMDATSDSH